MQVHEMLNADGVFNRFLVVDIAYHSHHMSRCAFQYLEAIHHIEPREPVRSKVRHPHTMGKLVDRSHIALDEAELEPMPMADIPMMYSSVTGKQIGWEELTPGYWMLNMTSTVVFSDAFTEMWDRRDGKHLDIILELGPHATLQSPVQQILDVVSSKRQRPAYLSMLRRNKDAALTALDTIGKLWSHGCKVDMSWVIMRNVQFRRPKLLPDLPNYPWNHTKLYWHESHLSRANRFQVHGRYDLVGRPTPDSLPFQPRWRGFFRVHENPWIEEHQVQKTTIYPAAGMVSMVIEGARQLSDSIAGIEISQFKIEKAMLIPSSEHGLEYALNLSKHDDARNNTAQRSSYSNGTPTASASYDFSIFSKPLDGDWQQHGSGTVTIYHKQISADGAWNDQVSKERTAKSRRYQDAYMEAKGICDEMILPRQLYETLDVIGMNYGPLFRNITSLCKRDNHCHYVVRIPDTRSTMPAQFEFPHIIHPATLDSVFQTAFSFGGDSMVPSFIGSLYVSFDPGLPSGAGKELVGYAKAEHRCFREARVSFVMSDESWKDSSLETMNDPLIIVKDMTFTALTTSPDSGEVGFLPNHRNLCSEIVWENEGTGLEHDTPSDVRRTIVAEQPIHSIPGGVVLLIPHCMSPALAQLCNQISSKLQCASRTLDSIGDGKDLPAYCLSLLEVLCGDHFVWNLSEEDFAAFRVLVNSTKGVFWVTRGAQLESTDPRAGLFEALARTIQSEDPQKHLVTLDIAYDANLTDDSTTERIVSLFSKTFSESGQPGLRETDYADREGQLMVPRLLPIQGLNRLVERGSIPPQPVLKPMNEHEGSPLKLKIGEIGKPDSLYWVDDAKANLPLAPNEVKIKVLSAGLSTLDTDIILGHGQDHSIGTDVYGIIESIGDDIQAFAYGDRVIGIARGSFKEYVRCHSTLVQKVPEDIADPSLVLLPTSMAAASYALYTLANIGESDTILIHAGAGSFGQAAIRIATDLGAKVFTTAANYEQRQMLMECYHIPNECILGGSSTTFVESIMHLTDSRGVKVVFDPTGKYRDSSQDCVAEGKFCIIKLRESCH
jgi:NADPH:quinone reductase-like Zn-dependent oxidoreductase